MDIRNWLGKETAEREENSGSGNSSNMGVSTIIAIVTIDFFLKKTTIKVYAKSHLKSGLQLSLPIKLPENEIWSSKMFTLNRINFRAGSFARKAVLNLITFLRQCTKINTRKNWYL